jgi:HK97 family phage major capsid protein
MNSNTAATLQKLKNGNGDYIWRDRLVAGSPDTLLGRPVQYLETMPDADAGEAFLAVGDFKRGYFIVDHTTGVRTRPDNITEPGFYKVHTDKYLGGGVVDSNATSRFLSLPVPDSTCEGLRPLSALCGVQ